MAIKTYNAVVREDAPEIFLRLAETSGTNAADETRFGRDFTHSGTGPTLNQTGPVNKAVSYNGTDDETGYTGNMPITALPVTLEMWMKSPSSTSSSTNYSGLRIGSTVGGGYHIAMDLMTDGSNNLQARMFTYDNTTQTIITGASTLPKGEWLHVVAVFRTTTDRELYINGVSDATDSTSVGFPANLDEILISYNGFSSWRSGLSAEPAIYSYALSEERIRIHHAVGRGYTNTDSYGYAVLTSAPQVYLRLQETSGTNAADASGFERDFTHYSGVTINQTGPLAEAGSKACSYDDTNDRTANTTDSPISAFPFTLEAWLYAPSPTTASKDYGLWGVSYNSGSVYALIHLATDGSNNLNLNASAYDGTTNGGPSLSSVNQFKGQFIHVVVVHESQSSRKLYVNGVLVGTNTTTLAYTLSNLNTMAAGAFIFGAAWNYRGGQVAEPAIYTQALTEAQIRDHYAKGKQYLGADYRETVLKKCPSLYWRLGEASGTTAADETEWGRDGTYSGTPTLGATGALDGDADDAVTFDGTDDLATRSDEPITGYPFTLQVWAKSPASTSSNIRYSGLNIADTGTDTTYFWVHLRTDGSNNLQATMIARNTTVYETTSAAVLNKDQYHLLTCVFESATSRKLYVNGVLLATDTNSVSFPASGVLDIVSAISLVRTTNLYYSGTADEAQIFDYALSEAEIRENYIAGLAHFPTATDSYEKAVLNDAPEVFLRLQETTGTNAADKTKFARDFTHSGSPTLNQTGPISKAVSYDGTDDVTYLSTPPSIAYPVTFEWWGKTPGTTSISTAYCRFFYGKSDSASQYLTGYFLTDGSNVLNFQMAANDGAGSSVTSTTPLPKGEWCHLVMVFTSATDRKAYVNGVLQVSDTVSRVDTSFSSSTHRLALGSHYTSSPVYSQGVIAEPAVYNYALTEAQIRNHHAMGRGYRNYPYIREVFSHGPALHWRLNEASGNALDATGFKREGTPAGSITQSNSGGPIYNKTDDGYVGNMDASDDEVVLAGDDLGITAYPVTYNAWIKTPSSPSVSSLYAVNAFVDDGTGSNVIGTILDTDGSGNVTPRARFLTGGTPDNITGTNIIEADVFHMVTLVCRSATDREAYINGVSFGTGSTSRTFPSNLNDVVIGNDGLASPTFYAGYASNITLINADLSDQDVLDLYLSAFTFPGGETYNEALTDSFTLNDVFTVNQAYYTPLTDSVGMNDFLAPAYEFLLNETVELGETLVGAYLRTASDTVSLNDTLDPTLLALNTVADALGLTHSSADLTMVLATPSDGLGLNDAASVNQIIAAAISEGLNLMIGIVEGGEEYIGWVVNSKNMAISKYTGMSLNSMAMFKGVPLGCSDTDIYTMTGDTDDGTIISSAIKTGIMDFNTDMQKSMDRVYLGLANDGKLYIKITKEQGEERWYELTENTDAMHHRRVKIGKGVKGAYFSVSLVNDPSGADFELDKIILSTIILKRRVR